MLIKFCTSGSAARVPVSVMAAKEVSETEVIEPSSNKTKDFDQLKDDLESTFRKKPEAFEVAFDEPMPENYNTNLQEAFKKFRKQRQDEIKHARRLQLSLRKKAARDPRRMHDLRTKFVQQAKTYIGVPYARKYWSKDSPEYKSALFLDCCGLVRQVMRDLESDFGFHIGPWNQAYMFDTLPISRDISNMRPGDLVFMTGVYTSKKNKKQRHNMMHVEIWLGDGEKTIGARWNNGKVQVLDSYKFSPKSFTNEQYYFRSIDTWLMGVCKSYCSQHKWGRSSHDMGKKSIFFTEQQNLPMDDQKAGDDDSDDDSPNQKHAVTTTSTTQAATDNRDDEGSSAKSSSSEFLDKDDSLTQQQQQQQQQQQRRRQQHCQKRKKKRARKCRNVARKAVLPRSTKRALVTLEDRIDKAVARQEAARSAPPSQPSPSSSASVRQAAVRRPEHSAQPAAGVTRASQDPRPAKTASAAASRSRLRCSLVGSCLSLQSPYIPSKMPPRWNCPVVVGGTSPLEPLDLRQQFWVPIGRLNPMEHGALTERLTVARGMLAVIGASPASSLKKNRSCSDLHAVNIAAATTPQSGQIPEEAQSWHRSAPETLQSICSGGSTFGPDLASLQKETSSAATPSVGVGNSSDDEGEDSENDDTTSLACSSDCWCASGAEDCPGAGETSDEWDAEDEPESLRSLPAEWGRGAGTGLSVGSRSEWRLSDCHSDSSLSSPPGSADRAARPQPRRARSFPQRHHRDVAPPVPLRSVERPSPNSESPAAASGATAGREDVCRFVLPGAARDQHLPVRGGPSPVTATAPQDGNGKAEGGADGQGAAGSSGDPPESEQGGGDEAGGEANGEGSGRRSGRRGDKKTPGGRQAKFPAYSLPSNMTPTFFIGGGNGAALVEAPLLALGWKRTLDKNDERFRLKWVECKSKINYTAFKEGDQLVNHIPNCKLLTNKLGLLCSLQEYERVTLSTKGRPPRLKMSDFVPETYKLDERNDRLTFLETYKDGEIWICKPVGMNQGKGIFLLRSREEIGNILAERDAKKDSTKLSSKPPMVRIVQRYISNPLLLDGRKFDIRCYMLIASTVPYLLLFHHGYIRLSCLKYDGGDTNLTTHLTNQYVQKKDPSYKEVKEDTAWSMDKFNEYINSHYAADMGIEENWTFNTLTKQMQKIMLHLFNSVKHKLQCKMGYFDLYGLDFMIDANMKVWLIEVNVNPALNINCEALKEVIPGVVEETLYLALECFEKSRRNQSLLPLQSLKGFTVLHCGTQSYVVPRQARSVSPVKGDNPEKTRPLLTALTRNYSPPRSLPRMSLTTTPVWPYLSPVIPSSTLRRMPTSLLPVISHSTTCTSTSTNSTSNSGDDVRLKMTHASSSSVRKSKEKPDRGN